MFQKGYPDEAFSLFFVYLSMRKLRTNTSKLIIRVINDSDEIAQSLGITLERQDEIATLCNEADLKTERVTEMLEMVSPQLKHANELVLVGIILGQQLTFEKIQKDLADQGIQLDYDD